MKHISIPSAAVALLLLLSCSTAAVSAFGVLPHSSTFPSRLRGTPAHKLATAREHEYSASLGHQVNTSVNWLDMPLYHTNGNPGGKTFKNRWYYDTTFWRPNQEIGNVGLIYLSGEGPSTSSPGGYLLEIANATGALIVNCENRWYGESLPGPLTDQQLLLDTLNVSIVLADQLWFVSYVEQQLNNGQQMKWYVVGGSYSGAVSSWLRAAYPDRFMWSWSSSGVVHPIFDFTEFDGHIKKVVQFQCAQAIRTGFEQFSTLYDMDPAQVLALLGGVNPIFTKADIAWMLSDGTAMMVQYGGKDTLCNIMLNRQVQPGDGKATPYTDMLYRIHHAIDTFWGPTWLSSLNSSCYYSTTCLSDPKYAAYWGPSGRSWVTQCCTQFSWWQVGYHNSLRLKELLTTEYYTSQCRSMFNNPTMFPQVYTFNAIHGGATPHSTQVVATQGSDDPWQTAGVRSSDPTRSYYYKLAQCHGCGHCGDIGTPRETDPESLTEQRDYVMQWARKWMGLPPAPPKTTSHRNSHNKHFAAASKQKHAAAGSWFVREESELEVLMQN